MDPEAIEPEAIEPELDEVLQEEGPVAVPVHHTGPVGVHELPARLAFSRNLSVPTTTDPGLVEQIANEDLRRKYLYVSCTGFPVVVGHDKQMVADGTAGILPVGFLLPLPAGVPVYVRSTGAGPAVVSYWAGYWAD
jgi:hypothetical protein